MNVRHSVWLSSFYFVHDRVLPAILEGGPAEIMSGSLPRSFTDIFKKKFTECRADYMDT